MKLKYINQIIAAGISIVCSLCLFIASAYAAQGTEGDELQILEAQKLEIQLGSAWAGTEFSLRTDAGLYPDKIAVGGDGVLRLEIGGSKSYVLSCISTNRDIIPTPIQLDEPKAKDTAEPEKDSSTTDSSISGFRAILIIAIIMGIVILALIGHSRQKDNTQSDNDKKDKE